MSLVRPAGWTPPPGWDDYVTVQRRQAVTWKATTTDLPEAARAPAPLAGADGHPAKRANGAPITGPLPFCLPADRAAHNLLPDVREAALAMFDRLDIPWHNGVLGGPSNHLLDSQVQCVNALAPMVEAPDRLHAALGDTLGLGELVPFEDGTYVTFEYIGDRDYLGEGRGRPRRRGTRCTSVDAAFSHNARDGARELVLLEWKYTERYAPDPARAAGHPTRLRTYQHFLADPRGPVRGDLLAPFTLFDEPIYQLVRQQLLAHQIETDPTSGYDRVRVGHVLPAANTAYETSVTHTAAAALGDTTTGVWAALLRAPDRFVHVDPGVFATPEASGEAYAGRYGTG